MEITNLIPISRYVRSVNLFFAHLVEVQNVQGVGQTDIHILELSDEYLINVLIYTIHSFVDDGNQSDKTHGQEKKISASLLWIQ